MKMLYFILILFIAACSVAGENVTDQVELFSKKLKLSTENEKCILRTEGNKFEVAPNPPCFFLRNKEKGVQHFAYPDIKVEAVVIIAGTEMSEQLKREWGLSKELQCGLDSQGVIIKNGKVSLSDKIMNDAVLCKETGSDEKNFWYFSH